VKNVILTACLIALIGAGFAYGQSQPAQIKVSIDFPFTVGGKVLPAGQYEFLRDSTAPIFRVQGEGKIGGIAQILTRTAGEIHTTPEDAHLVFDVIGDVTALSEIWIPGQDGYIMLMTKGPHTHKVINVKY